MTGLSAQSSTFQIDRSYVTGLSSPTGMKFAPDGRLFVTEQGGAVRVITPGGQLLSTPFMTVGVRGDGERGLLGLAFDPAFTSNGYIYLFYTPNDSAVSRIVRVTASGDRVVSGSQVTIFEYGNFSGNHRGGDLHFGPDGKLYVGLGDAGEGPNAQSVSSFDGKILRLNSDGSIPGDNPTSFTNTSGGTMTPSGAFRAIWAIGLRNPYRFSFHPSTGAMRINDVGAGAWEEVNAGQAGRNYGWPTCEGMCSNSFATNPIYAHERGVVAAGEQCAITGGTFYTGNQFPASYLDNYFVVDYCNTWLRHIRSDNSFATFPLAIPQYSVDLKTAPDGSLLVLGHGAGTISRITSSSGGSNRNPTAQFTANPTSGIPPLAVNFDARASSDPDGDSLTYSWQFGDNTSGSGATTSHTYAGSGTFVARLTVSDGRGGSASQQLNISVGTRPTATITGPQDGAQYTAGETISFAGQATDPEDGNLPASAFSWTVLFHHDTHTHPELGPINGVTSGSFTAPTVGHTEDTVFYRIYLTVTDSSGVQAQATRDVTPRKAQITLNSNVPGAQVLLDGQPQGTPHTFTGVAGVRRTLDIVSPQTINGQNYQFASWSDGGAANHTITTPLTNTTYTVNLSPSSGSPAPPPPGPAPTSTLLWRFDNNLTENVQSTPTTGFGSVAYSTDVAPVSDSTASLRFTGAESTYVAVAGDRVLSGWSAATTSVWVKIDAATAASWGTNSIHTVLYKHYVLQNRILKDGWGELKFVSTHSDGSPFGANVTSITSIPTGVWVQLVTVHQGTTVTLYMNGQEAGSGSTGKTLGAANGNTFEVIGFGGAFTGLVDDLRLYDRALTAAEIASNPAPANLRPPTNIRIIR